LKATHYVGSGDNVYRQACRLGYEGIVSKMLQLMTDENALHAGPHPGAVINEVPDAHRRYDTRERSSSVRSLKVLCWWSQTTLAPIS
jgi:hypothetical protein